MYFIRRMMITAVSVLVALVLALALGLWLTLRSSGEADQPPPGAAVDRSLKPAPEPAAADSRLALVIGNADYAGARLANPVHDAQDIAKALKTAGFQVILRTDQDHKAMLQSVREFGDALRERRGVGVFYFSGHGMQVRGHNYLLPVGADIRHEDEIEGQALSAEAVLRKMESAGNATNLVLLDACRNNPLERSFRSEAGGLARMDAPSGTVLFYATRPGKVAADGQGRNSPFTAALVRAMGAPDLEWSHLVRQVATAVETTTATQQSPWPEGLLKGDFYFLRSPSAPAPGPAAAAMASSASSAATHAVAPPPASAPPAATEPEPAASPGWLARLAQWAGAGTTDTPSPAASASASHPPLTQDCAECPELVRLPGGTFLMGSPASEPGRDGDERQQSVTVGGFAIGKFEVTRAQFAAFVDATGYHGGSSCYTYEYGNVDERADRDWRKPGYSQSGNHPVVCVSLADAEAYARWLSGQTGRRYRLPTDAEWEYAARAGTDTARYWGNDPDQACGYANVADQTAQKKYPKWKIIHGCADDAVHTTTVGSYRANRFGLFDMLGNVWEWTCSAFEDGNDGHEKKCTSANLRRVSRGGSWYNEPGYVRLANRYWVDPTNRNSALGFRLAQD